MLLVDVCCGWFCVGMKVSLYGDSQFVHEEVARVKLYDDIETRVITV